MNHLKRTRPQKIARLASAELRKNQTAAEIRLWKKIRRGKIHGYKFLRQHPVFYSYDGHLRFFIADFYCHDLRLILELDGPVHIKNTEYDRYRSEILSNRGFEVVRFTNTEILHQISDVVARIKSIAVSRNQALKPHT